MRESGGVTTGGVAGEINVVGPITRPIARIGTTVLGSFKLMEVIGAGSFATAYLAEQMGTDRHAVVKITHPDLVAGANANIVQRRFEDELRALTRVRHPNLVTVFMAGETPDGLPAIAMEHVDGNTMIEMLEVLGGPLPPDMLEPCFQQIGSALRALHSAGIVHRDIAPSNIIVGKDANEQPWATLLDLGVAQLHDRALTTPRAVGTPRYIAPEQMLGKATPTSDMYSLGAVLWFAVTGQEIDEEFSKMGLDRGWGEELDAAPDPRSVRPDLPARLAEFISHMLSFREESRPTAREFVAVWPRLVEELRSAIPEQLIELEAETQPLEARAVAANAPVAPAAPPTPVSSSPTPVAPFQARSAPFPPPPVPTVPPAASPEPTPAPTAAPTRPLRAVVIDDNNFTRRFLESYLSRHDVEVTVVANAAELGSREMPDLAVVGGHLATTEPCELVQQVKQQLPALPVILTAQADIGERWRTCGARDLVLVPAQLSRLGALLDEVRAHLPADAEPEVEPLVDVAIVRALAVEEPQLVLETIQNFVGQFPEWLVQLASTLERQDAGACASVCREIEAAVVMVGARPLGEKAQAIRTLLEAGQGQFAERMLDELEDDFTGVFQELMQLRLELEASQG